MNALPGSLYARVYSEFCQRVPLSSSVFKSSRSPQQRTIEALEYLNKVDRALKSSTMMKTEASLII